MDIVYESGNEDYYIDNNGRARVFIILFKKQRIVCEKKNN